MELKIIDLQNYNPRIQERKTFKEKILDNAQKLFEGRNIIIKAFKDGTFRLFEEIEKSEFHSEFHSEFNSKKKSEQKFDESKAERVELRRQKYNELNELIAKNDKTIDKELFKRYFEYYSLGDMLADLCRSECTHSNKIKVNLIRGKLNNFKKDVNKMTMDRISIEVKRWNTKNYKLIRQHT